SLVIHRVNGLNHRSSGNDWPRTTLSGAEFASLSAPGIHGNLDQVHAQLVGTTKDQEAEHLFSMTPSQYNSLTSADFTRRCFAVPESGNDDSDNSTSAKMQPSQQRRNLAETLRSMREQSKGDTAAEVYTRSLLWEKIPSEVVREFKRMVEESNTVDDGVVGKVEA
ncbi:hypothetical protein LTS18_007247, partial [Coniosporium uncinatum]